MDTAQVVLLEETDSTNRQAKELARQGAIHGSWVLAGRQTAGRGRLNRRFFSPEGGLYLSVVLRPDIPPEELALMTPMAATAVRTAVERLTGISLNIKWVNDLYLGDKKVCGILCEAAGTAVIVGIGLNLKAPEGGFPPGINAAALQVSLQPSVVAEAIVEELCKGCHGLRSRDFLENYRKYNMVLQRELMIHPVQGAPYPARGKAIDHRGRLVVETVDGNEQVLDSGEVSIGFYTKRSEQA
ncbi:MAG: biotin--[Clostridia bacterium]|nr:biotin--[acetyl-CoA-carboxylase] ligase [Clostridia bacterium]